MSIEVRTNAAWARIETWLSAHAPVLFRSLRPGASAEAIDATERALRVRFPADVAASIRRHDGQRLVGGRYRPFIHTFFRLLPLSRMAERAGVWADLQPDMAGTPIEADRGVRPELWNGSRIPFLEGASGDLITVDMAPAKGGTAGQLVKSQHDSGGLPVVAPSWLAFLERFAFDLEAGRYPVDGLRLEGRKGGYPFFRSEKAPRRNTRVLRAFEEEYPDLAGRRPGIAVRSLTLSGAIAAPETATDRLSVKASRLPADVGRLRWLRGLTVEGKVETLPPELGYLRALETLTIGEGRLRDLPAAFADVGVESPTGLSVRLPGNPLESIPEVLLRMAHLVALDLSKCHLGPHLPRLGEWPRLESLDLSDNDLHDLPPLAFPGLNKLKIRVNPGLARAALERLGALVSLTELDANDCDLAEIPTSWAALVNLERLDLAHNPLRTLPALSFPRLTRLGLGSTQLSRLADLEGFLAGCPALTEVDLWSAAIGSHAHEVAALRARFPAIAFKAYGSQRRSRDGDAPARGKELITWNLHRAAITANLAGIAQILDEGEVGPDAWNAGGDAPLVSAAELGLAEVVTLLLDRGADPNARGRDRRTPLLAACQGGFDAVRVLVERGADLSAKGAKDAGAVWYALEAGDTELARWLLDRGAPADGLSPLPFAVGEGDVALCQQLLSRGATFGDALHVAILRGSTPLLRLLLAAGAPLETRDVHGRTALFLASWKHPPGVELLLAAGADPTTARR